MGKIRTTLVKRTARKALDKYPDDFKIDFDHNKFKLEERYVLPSKKMRNRIAGYLTHLFRRRHKQ